ncbi:fasciclin domain-containing protein [Entomobacter blattae]|uniref:Fasciclin domain protein n=1 Tax=Entomobacter blattae TaxID=2762277 RepID=A0A7H1NTB5_9PROT|nr:fasciclin domain-containing protein [Entomobacter blattae]QNT79025.1 Fasciclin domain protein [Entomobacter blattae]
MQRQNQKRTHRKKILGLVSGIGVMALLSACDPDPRHERECIVAGTPEEFCKDTARADPFMTPLGVAAVTPPGGEGSGAFRSAVMPIFSDRTISESVRSSLSLANYRQIMDYAGLMYLLDRPGPLTVFALTNNALEKLELSHNGSVLDQKPESKESLKRILAYTIVPGDYSPAVIQKMSRESKNGLVQLTTLQGYVLFITPLKNGKMKLINMNGEQVDIIQPGITQANGAIYMVDQLIMPAGKPFAPPLLKWL